MMLMMMMAMMMMMTVVTVMMMVDEGKGTADDVDEFDERATARNFGMK